MFLMYIKRQNVELSTDAGHRRKCLLWIQLVLPDLENFDCITMYPHYDILVYNYEVLPIPFIQMMNIYNVDNKPEKMVQRYAIISDAFLFNTQEFYTMTTFSEMKKM